MVESEGLDINNNNLDQSVPSTQEVSSAPEMVQSEGADINNNNMEQGVEEPQEVSPTPKIDVYALEEKKENPEPLTVSEFYREMGKISEKYLDTIFSIQEIIQDWTDLRNERWPLQVQKESLEKRIRETSALLDGFWNSFLRSSSGKDIIKQRLTELKEEKSNIEMLDREKGYKMMDLDGLKLKEDIKRNEERERALRRHYAGGESDPEKYSKISGTISRPDLYVGASNPPPKDSFPRVTYADKVAEQDFRRATNPRRMEELAKANELNAPTSRFIDEFNALPRDRQEDLRAYARQLRQEREERKRSEDTDQEEFTA
ncbi:MAG: hypothetical protein PHP96_01890 [Candidatus Dojkabacteria bacterium]|nr:hypothetical protein [Candidatus Dojkabacteria bacterium]MDD4560826.1 hypothetical protein [Candidatus Dojkabacteria bacterium]NLA96540.1 hypothetical protein [Clostridiaceae bacterium]